MEEIKLVTRFSKIYTGKLFPEYFPTVRMPNPDKYFVGALHDIVVDDVLIGTAKIVAFRSFQFKLIRDPLSLLDGGMYTPQYAAMIKRMYNGKIEGGVKEDTPFIHIVFKWEKRIFKIHVDMMNEYYAKILEQQRFIDNECR